MFNNATDDDSVPTYPIPISRLGHRYYLYDIEHITHLRITHHILGTLVGSLPQSPQQNLFLGLPLELTPEEARLLVSKGVCCIVDDVLAHRNGLKNMSKEDRQSYTNLLRAQGREAAAQAVRRAGYKTESALSKLDEKKREQALRALGRVKDDPTESVSGGDLRPETEAVENDETESLFSSPAPRPITPSVPIPTPTPAQLQAHGITPTTSHPPFPTLSKTKPEALKPPPITEPALSPAPLRIPSPPSTKVFNAAELPYFGVNSPEVSNPTCLATTTKSFNAATLPHFLPSPPQTPPPPAPKNLVVNIIPAESTAPAPAPASTSISTSTSRPAVQKTYPLPTAPPSYPLFAHLHSHSYFMSPGLRFGCQYCVYPGDPLRFHSHFLAVGADWDEELDLLTLVGGGRLGTGVKKGFLLGGVESGVGAEAEQGEMKDGEGVRCFCVEWGGM